MVSKAAQFKGTIIVVCIYLVCVLLLLLSLLFVRHISALFVEDYPIFTVLFIIGAVIISAVLTYNILYAVPDVVPLTVPMGTCPDGWTTHQTGLTDPLKSIECIKPNNVSWASQTNIQTSCQKSTASALFGATEHISKKSTEHCQCNAFYPSLMMSKESAADPYDVRCDFADMCNLPWANIKGSCSRRQQTAIAANKKALKTYTP